MHRRYVSMWNTKYSHSSCHVVIRPRYLSMWYAKSSKHVSFAREIRQRYVSTSMYMKLWTWRMVHTKSDVSMWNANNNVIDIGLQGLINISLFRSLTCLQISEFVVCPNISLHISRESQKNDIRQYVMRPTICPFLKLKTGTVNSVKSKSLFLVSGVQKKNATFKYKLRVIALDFETLFDKQYNYSLIAFACALSCMRKERIPHIPGHCSLWVFYYPVRSIVHRGGGVLFGSYKYIY